MRLFRSIISEVYGEPTPSGGGRRRSIVDEVYSDTPLDAGSGSRHPGTARQEGIRPASVASDVAKAVFERPDVPVYGTEVPSDPGGALDQLRQQSRSGEIRRELGGHPRLSERLPGTLGDMAQDLENVARGAGTGVVRAGTDLVRLPEQVIRAGLRTADQATEPGATVVSALRGGVPEASITGHLVDPIDEAARKLLEPEGLPGVIGENVGMLGAFAAAPKIAKGLEARMANRELVGDMRRIEEGLQENTRIQRQHDPEPYLPENAPEELGADPHLPRYPVVPEPERPVLDLRRPGDTPLETTFELPPDQPTGPPRRASVIDEVYAEKAPEPTPPEPAAPVGEFNPYEGATAAPETQPVDLSKLKKLSDAELRDQYAFASLEMERELGRDANMANRGKSTAKIYQGRFVSRSAQKNLNIRMQRLEEEMQRRGLDPDTEHERAAIEGERVTASHYPRNAPLSGDVPFSPETGRGALPIMGGLVGTGVGATVGAKNDPENRLRGALVGGALGATAGVIGGHALEVGGARGTKGIAPALAEERPAYTMTSRTPRKPAPPPQPPRAENYAKLSSFALDPAGEARLRAAVEEAGPRAVGNPKRVVTWEETRQIANSMGLDNVTRGEVKRMTGPEMLATRNIIATNIDDIGVSLKKAADETLPQAQRDAAQIRVNALEAQNQALLDRFIKARSEKGRDLNSLKILANRTSDPVVWLAKARELAGDRYTDEVRATILRLLGNEKGALGVGEEMLRNVPAEKRAALVQYMASLRRAGLGEKIVTFIKAGLLTNPKTHIANVASNTTMAALETVKDAPAALFDRLLSLSTGERTKTLLNPAELAAASTRGAIQGFSEARKILRGVPLDDALRKFDIPHEVNYDSAILNTYTKTVFRLLGAEDRVFRGVAFQRSIAEQAKLLAKASGQKAADLVRVPSDEMVLRAIRDAETAVFQDPTRISKALSGIARPFGQVGELALPFKRTPGAVATRVIEYSPVGLPIGIYKALRVALRGEKNAVAQQRAVEILARSTTGAAPVALGYWLAKKGLATGARPQNANDKDVFDLAGKQANSVLMDGEWKNVGRLSPLGNLIALGANLYAAAQDASKASLGERASSLAASTVKTVADQPFVTGIRGLAQAALDPQGEGGKLLENTAGMVIPAAVSGIARSEDSQVRDIHGPLENIQSKIPGQSQKLPGRFTALGDPMVREPGLMANLLNPLSPRKAETDPLIQELTRVNAGIPRLRPNAGETPSQLAARQQAVGRELRKWLTALMRDPGYRSAPTESQREMMEEVSARVKAAESRRTRATVGVPPQRSAGQGNR